MLKPVAVALAALLLALPAASAPAATTVERTIQDCDGDNLLEYTFGEEHVTFTESPFPGPGESCSEEAGESPRLSRKSSILNVLQLTDFQMVDEESPARVEFLDATQRLPGLQPFSAAYRPQESLTTQVTEAMVRQVRDAVSPVTSTRPDLTILTGDNADSQQYNETRWFVDILDGTTGRDEHGEQEDDDGDDDDDDGHGRDDGGGDRRIDPNSGIPSAACPGTPGSLYDGVRDSGQSGVAPDGGYYEPDSSAAPNDDGDGYSPDRDENIEETPGRDVTVRDFPGLFERANEPFEALGLDMPWYSAFGNHDALVQGNSPEAYAGPLGTSPEINDPAFHTVATGCTKVKQPSPAVQVQIEALIAQIEALRNGPVTLDDQEQIDALTGQVLALAQNTAGASTVTVPADARRCFLAKDDPFTAPPGPCATGSWIRQHFRTTGTPVGHGFAPTNAADCKRYGPEEGACRRAASRTRPGLGRPPEAVANHDGYYSFVPRRGVRFVVLDTITDECGSEFCSEGSVDDLQFQWMRGQIEAAATKGEYVMVFSHHTLRTIRFPTTDPSEQPVHYGQLVDRRGGQPQRPDGGETLEERFCQHPNVIALVVGHEHENYVERHDCADDDPPTPGANPHFWQMSTAAHIDWPQQSRMVELVNIRGRMSIVTTMLDQAGPPDPGTGNANDDVLRLASIGRELAYNDYQGSRGARGERQDRNVILPLDRPPPPFTP